MKNPQNSVWSVLTVPAPKTPYDVLLDFPELSLLFPFKQVAKILFFILDKLLCMTICFILIIKQLILCE